MEILSNLNLIKGSEYLGPGIVYAPFIPMVVLEPVDMWPGARWAYDIVGIKEWLRRKKIKSRYAIKEINNDFYKIVNVSTEQTEDSIIMNVDLVPKKSVQRIDLDFKIGRSGIVLEFPEDLPEL